MSTASNPFSIRRSAALAKGAPSSAEIFIYGDIGESWFGESITAAKFVQDLAALDVEQITVRINSNGGSVSDGLAIYNALKRHKAQVTVSVDGIAASIASLIAMAGDAVEIADNALMMIHAPWGGVYGNAVEMRKYADLLDKWADAMASAYVAKSGKPLDEIAAMLKDGQDHWLSAAEAVDQGFADSTVEALPIAASASQRAAAAARFASFPGRTAAPATPAAPAQPAPAAAAPNVSPAAAAAQPTEKSTMTDQVTTQPAAAATQPLDAAAIAANALAADKQRRTAIAAKFAAFAAHDGMAALQRQCEDDINCTPQAAGEQILAKLAQGATSAAGGYVVTVEAEADKERRGRVEALAARASMGAKADSSNPFRADTLLDHAKASLARAGRKTGGMDKMAIVAAAFTHTGGDFPYVLENIAHKAMSKGYEEADETFSRWTSKGTLTDFKTATRANLNDFGSLPIVRAGAEFKYGTTSDRKESIVLATYGQKFSITRQAIINDDLDAFGKIPRKLGAAAIGTVGDAVYAVLTANAAMNDGTALFHSNHANLAGTGTVLSTTSIDAAMAAMAKQTAGGRALNIPLAYIIVPVSLRGLAQTVASSQYEITGSKNNTTPNYVQNRFEVVSDARLDVNSAIAWYGAANANRFDTIEVSYLDGNEAPYLEAQNGWDVAGVEFKVRIDAGVSAIDFRTLYKNPGA